MMPRLFPALAASLVLAGPALADIETLDAQGSVPEVMDRLEAAVNDAGATIFARVDHAAGAEGVGIELPDSQLLIFGNPMLGSQPMQQDIRAGLYLPLKVLVYADNGATRIAWQEVDDMFDDVEIDEKAEYMGKMEQALRGLATKASGAN